jgi:hypothetical protein
VLDIEHERDIERLRQVALLQKSQLEHLVAVLARKCAELQKLKGGEDELQLALKLLEDAQHEVAKARRGTGRRTSRRSIESRSDVSSTEPIVSARPARDILSRLRGRPSGRR